MKWFVYLFNSNIIYSNILFYLFFEFHKRKVWKFQLLFSNHLKRSECCDIYNFDWIFLKDFSFKLKICLFKVYWNCWRIYIKTIISFVIFMLLLFLSIVLRCIINNFIHFTFICCDMSCCIVIVVIVVSLFTFVFEFESISIY